MRSSLLQYSLSDIQGRCPCQQRPACLQKTCAPGYSGSGDHCYKFVQEAKTWTEARAQCRAERGDLASVHSRAENEFIRQLSRGDRLWLGGRRSRSCQACRDFTWSDGTAWDYDNWDQGEPNNYFQDEDCLELYTHRAAWNDDHCSLFSSPFVCKQARVCGSGSVNCGSHRAGDCSQCPWDLDNNSNYGAQWCRGDCVWRYGNCQPKY